MEPDHYQRITAEHIAISELTDEHYAGAELTDATAQAALAGLLTGTLWQVGNVTASGTQTADLSLGSVWQNVRTIEQNWNVYITPRVTFNTSGITGRYLDIAPAQGTWRGVRLSLDKNADDVGVVIDDTNVITAIYGYGAMTDGKPLDFSSVTWAQTADHPAKPAGQKYLEDPAATAAYGRNGRPRYGYYQNSDIDNAETLLQKAWESLKV
jgi:phage minor structural protein